MPLGTTHVTSGADNDNFTPPTVSVADKIRRPILAWGIERTNPQGTSSTFPANDLVAQRHKADLWRGALMPGPIRNQRGHLGSVIFLTESWCGLPPMNSYDQGAAEPGGWAIPTSGKPPWWMTLHNAGYLRYGPGILCTYPGGAAGFFADITAKALVWRIASTIDPFGTVQNYSGTNPLASSYILNYVPTQDTLDKIRAFRGDVLFNMESTFPYSRPIWLTPYSGSYFPAGAYLVGQKNGMALRDGVTPSDAAVSEEYHRTWLAADGMLGLLVKKCHELMPNSRFLPYEWILGSGDANVGAERPWGRGPDLMDEEQAGELDDVFRIVDGLVPSHGYLPYDPVPDNATPNARQLRYSDAYRTQSMTLERCDKIVSRTRKPLYVCCRTTGGRFRGDLTGRCALSPLAAELIARYVYESNATGAFIWESMGYGEAIYDESDTLLTTMEQEMALAQTVGAKRLVEALDYVCRTPRVP